jgi:hypothetical protein
MKAADILLKCEPCDEEVPGGLIWEALTIPQVAYSLKYARNVPKDENASMQEFRKRCHQGNKSTWELFVPAKCRALRGYCRSSSGPAERYSSASPAIAKHAEI